MAGNWTAKAPLGGFYPCHIGGAYGAVIAQHDGWENLLPDIFGPRGGLRNYGGRGKVHNGQIRLHPSGDIADLVLRMQGAGAAHGGQIPAVGCSRHW